MGRALVSSRVVIHYRIDASISSSHDRKAYISTYSSFGDNPPPGRKYQLGNLSNNGSSLKTG